MPSYDPLFCGVSIVLAAIGLGRLVTKGAPMHDSVEEVRKRIDAVDRRLLAALSKRAELGARIGRIKERLGLAIEDIEREQEVIRQLRQQNPGPLDDRAVERIFRTIIAETKKLEKSRRRGGG